MAEGNDDFREVAHCGGKIEFHISTDESGRRGYSIRISHVSPTPAALFAVYALPEGIACGDIRLGGIGDHWNPPPFPECIGVFIQSDSQGRFGHRCPECASYFRSSGCAPTYFPMSIAACGVLGGNS
jgi:hypothetical protein